MCLCDAPPGCEAEAAFFSLNYHFCFSFMTFLCLLQGPLKNKMCCVSLLAVCPWAGSITLGSLLSEFLLLHYSMIPHSKFLSLKAPVGGVLGTQKGNAFRYFLNACPQGESVS